ncbi:MAG: hypothetical protein QW579_05295 [Desulfurococcaceae archaeon]
MKFKIRVPHTYGLLFLVLVFVAILTWILPAGEYERVKDPKTGRTVVVPGTYKHVEPRPLGVFDVFTSIIEGLIDAADVIFFIFVIGGLIQVTLATGALDAAIGAMVRKIRPGRELIIFAVLMVLFSMGGATFGMAEETLAFIPVMVAIAISLGYDAIVGLAIPLVGALTGFFACWINPFTLGLAQTIAELPLFSGLEVRIVIWAVSVCVAVWWTLRYARKVKVDPTKSLMYGIEVPIKPKPVEELVKTPLTLRRALALAFFMATFVILVYGVFVLEWWLTEMSALFVAMAIVIGLVGGLGFSGTFAKFVDGAMSLTYGALIVGFARSISIALRKGRILDTVIYYLAEPLRGAPPAILAIGHLAVQTAIDFFIPSGSGQAVAIMPIMIPVADITGVLRQVAVQAFVFGDGITNLIWPTAGVMMAAIGMINLPYSKWLKWVLPLALIWYAIAIVVLVLGQVLGWGPF